MTKYTVLTDGNGSDLIQVVGLGVYVPLGKFQQLETQNAELVAQVEKMRSALELAFISVKTCYKQDLAPYSDVVQVEKAIKLSPKNNLRDRDAEAGRAGFVAACLTYLDEPMSWIGPRADEYAENVRKGE